MRKWVKAITYVPKISAVISGDCRQTIREGNSVNVGDEILFHGWEAQPYRSKWNWRMRVVVTEAIPIHVDYNIGIGFFNFPHEQITRYGWNSELVNTIARRDFVDPPTGIELRDVLFGLNRKKGDTMQMQIIRW